MYVQSSKYNLMTNMQLLEDKVRVSVTLNVYELLILSNYDNEKNANVFKIHSFIQTIHNRRLQTHFYLSYSFHVI